MSNSPTPEGRMAPRPLTVIRKRFRELADRPVGGLPPGWDRMKAGRMAGRLLSPRVPAGEVDAVWVQLIEQARTRDETAVLICVGTALPMLHKVAAWLCGHPAHRADTESMVVVAFLDAVSQIDLTRPNVASRLRWATFHRTCPPVRERKQAPIPVLWFNDGPIPDKDHIVSSPPHGHPEQLLALAVGEGVISTTDAILIADTRLNHRRLTHVAAETATGYEALAKRRRRAEQRLAVWLRQRLADTQTSSDVETAALDHLTPHPAPATQRRDSARPMSTHRRGPGVLPMPESVPSADPTTAEENPRCA
ncbi:hypothetical protein [Nocardia blacklockiae]|uniref:hypothetical protein n=1 Tax=Nocardia blacklockiae TaxID=480036 RepID=UPI00189559EF|nr:hypothetical protein [Nocardia blacklockiae]MBF6175203.1 hypothetical protein [Nocardia blacklockiae]